MVNNNFFFFFPQKNFFSHLKLFLFLTRIIKLFLTHFKCFYAWHTFLVYFGCQEFFSMYMRKKARALINKQREQKKDGFTPSYNTSFWVFSEWWLSFLRDIHKKQQPRPRCHSTIEHWKPRLISRCRFQVVRSLPKMTARHLLVFCFSCFQNQILSYSHQVVYQCWLLFLHIHWNFFW